MKLVLKFHCISPDSFPYYELKDVPPTAVADLEKAYKIAKECRHEVCIYRKCAIGNRRKHLLSQNAEKCSLKEMDIK